MSERLDELQRRFEAEWETSDEGPLSLGEMQELCCLQGAEIERLREENSELAGVVERKKQLITSLVAKLLEHVAMPQNHGGTHDIGQADQRG